MSNKPNPFETGYYNSIELRSFGFKSVGNKVLIAKNCTIVGVHNISIGNNVIIDAFCSIIVSGSGSLHIGSYVHIGAFCHLLASEGIEIKDFSGLSQGVKVYSKTDDYSGNSLTNPTIPSKYKSVKKGKVIINEHVIVGAGSVILPNVNIGEGASIGALALISTNLEAWMLYVGNPIKKLAKRSKNLLKLKADFLGDNNKAII